MSDVWKRLDRKQRREFERFARSAIKGVGESAVFLQLFNTEALKSGQDLAYALQLGAAIMLNKPIVIVAPEGAEVPQRLRAIALSVQFFIAGDNDSMMNATKRALEAAGLVKH